jgi:hypothetical protein
MGLPVNANQPERMWIMTAIYTVYQTVRDADGEEVEASRWNCADLRDAITDLEGTRTAHVDGVQYRLARYTAWSGTLLLTTCNGMEFRTGCSEERVLAIVGINQGTARRLSRMLNAEWGA